MGHLLAALQLQACAADDVHALTEELKLLTAEQLKLLTAEQQADDDTSS